jgi:anti-sigma B factor antagonist
MSEDAEPHHRAQLSIDARHDGAEATIILDGELDIRTVERFLASIQDALEAQPASVAVDAGRVAFLDSSGLAALLHARSATAAAGVRFRIREASPKVRRMAEVAGISELLLDD